jgi:nitrate reductase NapAB chaperone NapD
VADDDHGVLVVVIDAKTEDQQHEELRDAMLRL